jgi:hypothetical protein
MPPKIEGMPKHLTLLLHGENKLDDESIALVGNGLAHEQYLLGESFPLAGALAGPESDNLQRICIEPVHLHATRDHLVLLQLDPFQIAHEDLSQLMNEASAMFSEEGLGPLTQVAPFQWLGKTEGFKTLHTHSAAQAQGRNIDWWLPKDTRVVGLAKRWRQIQNEVQMRWHIHPINQARSEQGLPTINSIWLSGISHQHDVHLAHELKIAQKIISDQAWMPRVAQNHSLVCMSDPISRWEDLAENTLIYHRQAKQMWPAICQMLLDHDLVLEVIDFPKSVRKRRFASDDFRAHPLAFWRKSKVPTWEELNA